MVLGSNCHFRQGYVPVTVITDLNGKLVLGNNRAQGWILSSARSMYTRIWSAAEAMIVLTAHAPDMGKPLTPLPSIIKEERDLCIWQGWVPELAVVTQADLEEGRLFRNLVGIIDLLNVTSSKEGATTLHVHIRDRVRWLMDTRITYAVGRDLEGEQARSTTILHLAQRGIGQVEGKCTGSGRTISESTSFTYDIARAPASSTVPSANSWYLKDQPLQGYTKTKDLKVSLSPEFRIFTGRDQIDLANTGAFLVDQEIPIDAIKTMALQEVYATEVFQDNRDGNLYYAPRGNDDTGLDDPTRFFRTYFNRQPLAPITIAGEAISHIKQVDGGPQISTANHNNHANIFREERSSIGQKTDFIIHRRTIVDNTANTDWSLHFKIHPANMPTAEEGGYASRFLELYDETIQSELEAAVIAINAAQITGKAAKAGMLQVLGDPTLVPGEIIQVIGSPLLSNNNGYSPLPGETDPQWVSDRRKFTEYNRRYSANLSNLATIVREKPEYPGELSLPTPLSEVQGSGVNTVPTSEAAKIVRIEGSEDPAGNGITADDIICSGDKQSGYKETLIPPQTIFRVEAVIQQYNIGQPGYVTELALSSPF